MIKPDLGSGNKHQPAAIHIAQRQDAAAIARLAQELAAYEGHATDCDEKAIEALLSADHTPACHLLVAKIMAETVGFAICYPGYDLTSHSYGLHLADICVAEAHRKKGIGRQLISTIAAMAQTEGREWLSLTVLNNNEAGRAFYERLGFVDTKTGLFATGKRGICTIIKSSLS